MLVSTVVAMFLAFWSTLYLADLYLRSSGSPWYGRFVQATGLVISPLQIRMYTCRLQSLLLWCSQLMHSPSTTASSTSPSRLQQGIALWFTLGVLVATACLLFMLMFLTRLVLGDIPVIVGCIMRLIRHVCVALGLLHTTAAPSTMHSTSSSTATMNANPQLGLVPIVPGVNVPWSHMPVFFLSLVIAAIHHRVGVTGFGVFLFAVYPGAFTELDNDTLESKSALKRLHIYCAGIWHNIILALGAIVCLQYGVGLLVSPAFMLNKGVLVTHVHDTSGLGGAAGVGPGDVVYGINYCKVYNIDSWHGCLHRMIKTNYGYCVPKGDVTDGHVHRADVHMMDGELECCGVNKTSTHLCFYYRPGTDVLPPRSAHSNSTVLAVPDADLPESPVEHACLAARHVTDHYVCNYSLPCSQRTVCVYPALFNDTKLLRFFIANRTRPVLFIGHPKSVFTDAIVSNFVPQYRWLPYWLPEMGELLLKYIVTFSFALGLLNAVPCYSLDGQFTVGVLLELIGFRPARKARRRRWSAYSVMMMYGTGLLMSAVCMSLIRFAFNVP